MSRSDIERGGQMVRPTFQFSSRADSYAFDAASTQLLESLRNLQESCNADALYRLDRIARTLDRIDRRLAKRLPIKGKK